jgi:hypothetical protein
VIGDRDARVRGAADGGGHAGYDFEWNALLVQKQSFLSAAAKQEWIAPTDARDDLALARLFGNQVGDRILIVDVRRAAANIDAFNVRPRGVEQSRVHFVIVNDHVRELQATPATQTDQVRSAWSSADQVDEGRHGQWETGA